MTKLDFTAKSFFKMEDPNSESGGSAKYVCYVQANSIPSDINSWMETNPREQKMTTNVARRIIDSLDENSNFHELNRGILLSAEQVIYNPGNENLTIFLEDPEKHGSIDGGHTLRAILIGNSKNTIKDDRYVFFEILTGIESPVELAAARNTSVQVDLKSIAELESSFEELKVAFATLPFKHRIQYKMHEHFNNSGIKPIDVREIIAIVAMFSQTMYPYRTSTGKLSDTQPTQCYSGKEATLRKFLNMDSTCRIHQKINRDNMVKNMTPIIEDIFKLWEHLELNFAKTANESNKRYGARKYSKYDEGKTVGKTMFNEEDLQYIIPKGIMYPLVGAFRSLVLVDPSTRTYKWKEDPIKVWKDVGSKLVTIILDEKIENPDVLAKNSNLWSNLFKEIYIYAYMS